MSSKANKSSTAFADVAAAHLRSVSYGLDSTKVDIPHTGHPGPAASTFNEQSSPVIDQFVSQVIDSSLAVVLADRKGRLTSRNALSSKTRRAMDDRSLDVGFSLAEEHVGTNGVGTSLETRRPAFVVGDQHFLETFHGFTCANAPIIHPISRKVEGTVGVMCPTEETSPLLLPAAIRLSAQISEQLIEQATPEERFLLEQFLRSRRNPRDAVATIGSGVIIASPSAQRELLGVDHNELWSHLQVALRQGSEVETNFEIPASKTLRLRCRPLHRGGEIGGAAIEFVSAPRPRNSRRKPRSPETLGPLVGDSAAWRHVVKQARHAGQVDEPVLIVGERGTGRLSVADAIARQRGAESVDVFSSAEVPVEGAQEWLLRLQGALSSGSTVVLRRIDQLADDVAAAVALMDDQAATASIIATSGKFTSTQPGLSLLLDQLRVLHIEIPPLRERVADIEPLARHFASRRGRQRLSLQVVKALSRQPWPGNATELDQAIRSAIAHARFAPVSVEHLPRQIRSGNGRIPLQGLRQKEADAIVAAIESTATRAEAAELLGISRATLFRRIRTYGLEIPN